MIPKKSTSKKPLKQQQQPPQQKEGVLPMIQVFPRTTQMLLDPTWAQETESETR